MEVTNGIIYNSYSTVNRNVPEHAKSKRRHIRIALTQT
jgi:hypothetical protein